MQDEILLTQEGYDKIEKEHEELVSVRRKEVSERLKEAISYGDLSENAEYDAAKDEQAELEERIQKLEYMLKNAQVVGEDDVTGEFVNLGLKVTVENVKTGEQEMFIIVGSTEADPFADIPRISNESEVGRNLLNKRVGEVAEAIIPDGVVHYKIVDISKE